MDKRNRTRRDDISEEKKKKRKEREIYIINENPKDIEIIFS